MRLVIMGLGLTGCLGVPYEGDRTSKPGDGSPPEDPVESSTSSTSPPHLCLGAMLTASWEVDLDAEALVAEIEAAFPDLECWANAAADFVECTPADDACGWSVDDAEAAAPAFLELLEAFDPAFEDYPWGVVDDCACRAF